MNTETSTPAARIDPDTYTGTWSRSQGRFRADVYTAGELAELLGTDGASFIIWKSFGHVRGVERFGRDRCVADADGNLHVYGSNGQRVVIHPAARKLRILTK